MLARDGLKVLCLEKTNWAGGMAATKELFKGYKHSVGAWAMIVLHQEMIDLLDVENFGFKTIVPDTSYCVYGEVEDAETREALQRLCNASAMDIIRRFFPDPDKHRTIQGSLAAMSIDGTHMGPYTPGSATSMAFHYTASDAMNVFKLSVGGIGALSEALVRALGVLVWSSLRCRLDDRMDLLPGLVGTARGWFCSRLHHELPRIALGVRAARADQLRALSTAGPPSQTQERGR